MSAAFAAKLSDALRRIEQQEEMIASLMRAMKAAEGRIKDIESKRGPGRPPNESRSGN